MKKYLIPLYQEMEKNYKTIKETYEILNTSNEIKLQLHSAGEWILDNMYIIEQEITILKQEFNSIVIKRIPHIKDKLDRSIPRIKYLSEEILENSHGQVDQYALANFMNEYQKTTYVTFEEIVLLPFMLKLAILDFIARVCIHIYASQLQKIKVEKLLDKTAANIKDVDIEKYIAILKSELADHKKVKTSNTAYIEYMAYRLKMLGVQGDKLYKNLEIEVDRAGFSIEEAIEKQHSEIAKTKLFVGNAIMSLKKISTTNWSRVFESINKIDEVLKCEYTKQYENMDYKTRALYRDVVISLAKKSKMSEMHVAKKAVECSYEQKVHVGAFLLDDEFHPKLLKKLGINSELNQALRKTLKKINPVIYSWSIILVALTLAIYFSITTLATTNIFLKIILSIAFFYIAMEIGEKSINYLIHKLIKAKILPRISYEDKDIDEENSVIVAMPTIISSKAKIEEMVKKMEVSYIANKSENVYFMLLGDCKALDVQHTKKDDEYFAYGKELVEKLNEKYPIDKDGATRFNFMYRKRVYSEGESCFMGWERKRGALTHLNRILLGKMTEEDKEKYVYLSNEIIPKVKYCFTIDEDTVIAMNCVKELVGIMAHPLNKPVLDASKRRVEKGYGLIQPAVGLDIDAANKSIFSKVFGGFGGIDIYTNAISNIYQDCFAEAIFTGKGIYDIALFEKLLDNKIPENLVLSHDLLEGSYMKTGLASDVEVQDGFPSNFISYTKRNHRWVRGDIQIARWIKPSSPLNYLSKWKMLDNIRRSTLDIFIMIYLILSAFIPELSFVTALILCFMAVNYGMIFSTVDGLIFGKEKQVRQKQYIPLIYGFKANILKMIFNFITIPYRAYTNLHAICITVYRMLVSKKKLLEWTTAASLDKSAKNTPKFFYMEMWPNLIAGILIVLALLISDSEKVSQIIVCILFALAPLCAFAFSLDRKVKISKQELTKKQKEDLVDVAKRTWKFFDSVMIETYNYLPTDNYQDNRRPKIVSRTSSTNIGLGLMAIIDAYDMQFITIEDCINRLEKVFKTITKLPKWHGHLYNWYDTRTLEILKPAFVSTVDSGNFVTNLFVTKQFLKEAKSKAIYLNRIDVMIRHIDKLINATDFTKLFDKDSNLFSIGFDIEREMLAGSTYDMLESEARQTSLVAIAMNQVSHKHWFALSRNIVTVDGYKGLASWSGTAFEYFMPTLFMKTYSHTLLDEAMHFAAYSQQKYGKINNIPWGISESSYATQDIDLNYQYKAFGIPWLGYKRGLNNDLVVSPYSTILMLAVAPKQAMMNLERLKQMGCYSTFGFYEAIDFTKKHLKYNQKNEVVKSYMAHHQGMAFTAINNFLNENKMQSRFHLNPEIEATEILLKERTPIKIAIKEKITDKDNVFVQKEISKFTSFVGHISKIDGDIPKVNILTNGKMSITTLDNGSSYIKYKDKCINKGLYKNVEEAGNFITFEDKSTSMKWSAGLNPNYRKPDKYAVNFSLDTSKYTRTDGDIETTLSKTVATEYNLEMNKITLKNNSDKVKEIVVNTYVELTMIDYLANIVHPAFNNLQIESFYDKDLNVLIAKKRGKTQTETKLYTFVKMIGIDEQVDYETEKARIIKKDGAYDDVISKYPLWPALSMRTVIKLKPYSKKDFYYLLGVTDNRYDISHCATILDFAGVEELSKLAAEKASVVSRYLRIEPHEAMQYNNIIAKVLFSKKDLANKEEYWNNNYSQSMLWKYGISGDIPIMLVKIDSIEDAVIIKDIIKFMDYVKQKKFDIDVIVLIKEDKGSSKTTHIKDYLLDMLRNVSYMSYTKGNVYILREDELDQREVQLFKLVAGLEIDSNYASLEGIAKTAFNE
ncbi:MAG: glucoamylase family protein [Clostridia bacterium]